VEANSIAFEGKEARLALAIDITQKLKAELALEASEHRFKALVQDGSDLIAILDENGIYKYVSPTSSSILGVDPVAFIGKCAFDFIHPDDMEFVRESFMLLQTTKRIEVPPFRFNAGSGEYRWIDTVITDMLDEQGVEGLVANSRDITGRMQDNIKMKESVERYETVSKATSDAIWDWNVKTDIVTWNKGIKGIFGYDHLQYSHTWWLSQMYPEDIPLVTKHVESLIEGHESKFEVEYRFRCANGTFKYVLDRGFIMFDNQGKPYRMIGSMQDITQRKEYIEKIEAQNRRLLDISWLQSHYVRAPLSQIMGLVKMLTDEHSETADRESLTYLAEAAEQLDTIIKSIIKNTEGI
jgi:PAS domain S-box-containing protein